MPKDHLATREQAMSFEIDDADEEEEVAICQHGGCDSLATVTSGDKWYCAAHKPNPDGTPAQSKVRVLCLLCGGWATIPREMLPVRCIRCKQTMIEEV